MQRDRCLKLICKLDKRNMKIFNEEAYICWSRITFNTKLQNQALNFQRDNNTTQHKTTQHKYCYIYYFKNGRLESWRWSYNVKVHTFTLTKMREAVGEF